MKRHASSVLFFVSFYLLNLGVYCARVASRWIGVDLSPWLTCVMFLEARGWLPEKEDKVSAVVDDDDEDEDTQSNPKAWVM